MKKTTVDSGAPRDAATVGRPWRRVVREGLLTFPSLGWLVVFFLVPTIIVALIAFRPYDYRISTGIGTGWSFESIRGVIDKDYPALVWRTVWVSVASAVICIALAIPMAYTMARASQRMRSTILMLTIVPFWTSFIIRIFAWMQVLHTDGFLKRTFVWLHLMSPDQALMYNMGAVLLVMVYTSLPFAILPLYAAAEKFDFSLMDAAQDLGATRFRSVLATFIPGIRSGILYATLMVLVPNLGCYVTSDNVGGPDCMLMGNRIKTCAIDFTNLPHACALSLFLMVGVLMAFTTIFLVVRVRGGREAVAEIAKSAAESMA